MLYMREDAPEMPEDYWSLLTQQDFSFIWIFNFSLQVSDHRRG